MMTFEREFAWQRGEVVDRKSMSGRGINTCKEKELETQTIENSSESQNGIGQKG